MVRRSASSSVAISGRQYSWSHSTGTRIGSELLQEADVVLVEDPQVRNAMLEHRDPLDSHPEGEPLHLLGVVSVLADVAEHVRIDHPGAQDLEPGVPLADRAAQAVRARSVAAV